MAITKSQGQSASSTGTGSVVVNFGPAIAGHLLVVAASYRQNGGDSDINTPAGWTPVSIADINNTGNLRGRMFWKVAAGGETSVTLTAVTGTGDMAAYMMEFAGTATTSVEDQAAENFGATSPCSTGAIAAPAAGAVGVGFVAINNNNVYTAPQNGYTLDGNVVSANASAGNQTRLGMLYNLAPGATATGLTQGGTARAYVGQLVTFNAAPAAGTSFVSWIGE